MASIYTRSARFYDLFTMDKDYATACRQLMDVFHAEAPAAKTLLDVGCGTGRHLEHLQAAYAVTGIDSNEQMLGQARRRCIRARLHQCDLSRFDLGCRFDIVACLFGAIAYAGTVRRLRRAVRCLASHLNPGGLLVIEPWVSGDSFVEGRVVHDSAADGKTTVERMYALRRARSLAVLDVHYLVGRPCGVTHFSERHRLGLFSDQDFREAISAAGLTALDIERQLFGYGLYAAKSGSPPPDRLPRHCRCKSSRELGIDDKGPAKKGRMTAIGDDPRRRRNMTKESTGAERHADACVDVRDPRTASPPCKGSVVRIMRPQLPTADRIMPYLRQIDAARVYANHGPLVQEFEARLARHFRQRVGSVTTASSGTMALVGAILATAGRARRARPLAIMPAFTFVATALAAEQCGYRPCFVDIDPETLQIDPLACERSGWLPRAGVVIPVAAFGRPVALAPWRAFRDRTSVPVVIDGAASFETVATVDDTLGCIPVCMSFHATKSFAIGEGGCVVTEDDGLAARVVRALNFGFFLSREIEFASGNGKLSEYHAAVGLAELDAWDSKSHALAAVASVYHRHMAEVGLADRLLAAPTICSTNVLFRCRELREAAAVQFSLERCGIEHRLWYGRGLHQQPYFEANPRQSLSVTDRILPCLVGLPMAVDLPVDTIARIVSAVQVGLRDAYGVTPTRAMSMSKGEGR